MLLLNLSDLLTCIYVFNTCVHLSSKCLSISSNFCPFGGTENRASVRARANTLVIFFHRSRTHTHTFFCASQTSLILRMNWTGSKKTRVATFFFEEYDFFWQSCNQESSFVHSLIEFAQKTSQTSGNCFWEASGKLL